jgi:hypothetical protein
VFVESRTGWCRACAGRTRPRGWAGDEFAIVAEMGPAAGLTADQFLERIEAALGADQLRPVLPLGRRDGGCGVR